MQPTQLPLKDIHVPDAIGWWPPAIGWWLIAVLIPLLFGFGYWFYKRTTRKTAIKTAQAMLAELKINTNQNNHEKLRQISVLMRRFAVTVSPRQQVASLVGNKWLAFLDQKSTGTSFQKSVGSLLTEGPYRQQSPSESEISQLISLCEDWLQQYSKQKP